MSLRNRVAASLAALLIAATVTAAPATAAPAVPPLPGPIQLPNAQCPLWVGLNIIPIGCVPWAVIIESRFPHLYPALP